MSGQAQGGPPAAVPGARPPATSGLRLPRAPYPGLRPFLPYEEVLLFGRERQVREVIGKLQETQFVAVIGGSGSGKSSLVLAGVVPELRSFGIAGAGDFWVPMICTPGTNASRADEEKRLNTPITRLARKFAALLRTRGSPADDEARVGEIAACLREELGFAHLIERYTAELAAPPGPDPKDARFLLVIDQFEELFHPTTRHGDDAKLLVERVIDHFFSPHARCYIVLTMRSEHLNDCAGFLELPDAINKSSYLVRRLDDDELEDAIVKPPRRLLRLKRLADEGSTRLPADVEFDAGVITRLVRDARRISDDPDHLPLLQHALARAWQAASLRVADHFDLPDRLTVDDLAKAAGGLAAEAGTALADGVNVLRASVEHWAEAAYQRHDEAERRQLNLLLPRLGVRDPNTGMYSQQRIHVAEFAGQLGPGKTVDDLRRLVANGFLGEVNYLYWDDDDPRRITLKVSHESLLRGWARLRGAIDVEAERFDEFVGLLRKCDKWQRAGRNDSQLLVDNELLRFDHEKLGLVLDDRATRQAWFARLGAAAGHDGLARQHDAVDEFVRLSRRRLALEQERELRRSRQWKGLVAVCLFLVFPAVFFGLILGPLYSRTELLMKSTVQSTLYVPERQAKVGSQTPNLKLLLDAAADIDRAREGDAGWDQRVNVRLLSALSGIPFISRRIELFDHAAATAESGVNKRLRQVLTSAVWPMPWPKTIQPRQEVKPAELVRDVRCEYEPRGQLLRYTFGSGMSRAIYIPKSVDPGRDSEVRLYAVRVDAGTAARDCQLMQILRPTVGFNTLVDPSLVFDAQLRFFWVVDNKNPEAATATLFELESVLLNSEGLRRTRAVRRVQISDAGQIAALKGAITASGWHEPPSGTLLPTLRLKGGRATQVGDEAWRVVDATAQPLLEKADFVSLTRAEPQSACARLGLALERRAEHGEQLAVDVWQDQHKHCFAVTIRTEEAAFLASVGVEVYAEPGLDGAREPQPSAALASIERFTRVPLQGAQRPDIQWRVGTGDYAGWLQASFKSFVGTDYSAVAPWSTCALYRFGHEVLGSTPDPAVCKDR